MKTATGKLKKLSPTGLVILFCLLFTFSCDNVHESPSDLRTEDRTEPVGIDDLTPEFSWTTADYESGSSQRAYQVIVASSPEKLDEANADLWNSGKIRSSSSAYITYAGQPLKARTIYYWKARTWNNKGGKSEWSGPASFETGLLTDEDWNAEWIWRKTEDKISDYCYFRKSIFIPGKIPNRARLYISACNRYELYINGSPAGKGPNFAYPDKQFYQTFDITSFLKPGIENVVGILGVHWGRGGQGRPAGTAGLIVKTVIGFEDGSELIITSDSSWKTREAEWINTNLYRNGEGIPYDFIDGRLYPAGWNRAGYDDSEWKSALVAGKHPAKPWTGRLIAQETSISEYEIKPVNVKSFGKGRFVADFGKIYSGIPKIEFTNCRPGTTIKIKADYNTDENGLTDGISQNTKMDYEYITRGGVETFRPFWYMGFRYLEIENAPESFDRNSVSMIVRHNSVNMDFSSFECSDTMINKIWDLAKRSCMMSSHEQFLDTPTREQGQFTYDSYLISGAVMRCFLERDLTQQALRQFAESQVRYHSETGKINAAYPNNDGKRDITDWTQSFIFMAYEYFMNTGDKELIREIFDQLVNTGEYIKKSENPATGLIDWGSFDPGLNKGSRYPTGITDWVNPFDYDLKTSQRTVLNFNGYLDYLYVSFLADAIGEREIGRRFKVYAGEILQNIKDRLWDEEKQAFIDGLYEDGTKSRHASQQANAMALSMNIAGKEQKSGITKVVREEGYKTGMLITPFLIRAYGETENDEALFDFLTNPEGNNYAKIISSGGTFCWEDWNLTEKHYSQSHGYGSYAAIVALQDYILGVKALSPQYAHIRIKPHLTRHLKYAKGKIPTQRGEVEVSWENTEKGFMMQVGIPFNTKADVYLPSDGGEYIVYRNLKPGRYNLSSETEE